MYAGSFKTESGVYDMMLLPNDNLAVANWSLGVAIMKLTDSPQR